MFSVLTELSQQLSDVVRGLQFLHENFIVHGALRPVRENPTLADCAQQSKQSHVLIDDWGNAQLASGGHSSIMAVPGTPFSDYLQPSVEGDLGDCRYLAPEIQWPEDYGTDKILITKESDIYGMAMVIYEARSYKPISPEPGSNLTSIPQVLTGVKPYQNSIDTSMSSRIHAEVIPERFTGTIDDTVWNLLEGCWSKVPAKRPTTVKLYNALSDVVDTPREPVIETLPPELRLFFLAVVPLPTANPPKRGQFYLKLRYGEENHTTPPTDDVKDSDDQVKYAYAHFCRLPYH